MLEDLAASAQPVLDVPIAQRRVRAWLEPAVMLQRYWAAWSTRPPPRPLQELLDALWQGQGLYLYVPSQQTTDYKGWLRRNG